MPKFSPLSGTRIRVSRMSAVPEMSGYTPEMKGQAALAEFNLATSELRRVIPVPPDGRDHGLGDLCVAPDGTVP